jgi:hypothetical protein
MYIPTDAERKQCCLNCRKFSGCALVARWKAERDEDGFYPNALKCGDFKGNWVRVPPSFEAIVQGCPGVS